MKKRTNKNDCQSPKGGVNRRLCAEAGPNKGGGKTKNRRRGARKQVYRNSIEFESLKITIISNQNLVNYENLDNATFTLFFEGVTVEFAFLPGSGGSPEIEVEFGAVWEDVGFALIGVGEAIDATEPAVHLLRGVTGADGDVGASIHN